MAHDRKRLTKQITNPGEKTIRINMSSIITMFAIVTTTVLVSNKISVGVLVIKLHAVSIVL